MVRQSRAILLPELSSSFSLRSAVLDIETEITSAFTWGGRLMEGGAVLSK